MESQIPGLDPALTFENWNESSSNRSATLAGMDVASTTYRGKHQSLFIYADEGLGKTHLLHAIGKRFVRDQPDKNVFYDHAKTLILEVVEAYQGKSFMAFKIKYLSADLLLMDDVQILAGMDRSQEEFIHIFDILCAKQSAVVLASNTFHKWMWNIPAQLAGRLSEGLTVTMEPPVIELRMAILMNKARSLGTEVPTDALFLIAKNVEFNKIELEILMEDIFLNANLKKCAISGQFIRDSWHHLATKRFLDAN